MQSFTQYSGVINMESFILISLDTIEQNASIEEHQALMVLFEARPLIGCNNGIAEVTYLVPFKYLGSMFEIAERYKQESILVYTEKVELIYISDLSNKVLGNRFKMSNVTPDVDSWTLIDGVYYYV